MRLFVGKAVKDEAALIEARTGRPVTEDWLAEFRERRNDSLNHQMMRGRRRLENLCTTTECRFDRISR